MVEITVIQRLRPPWLVPAANDLAIQVHGGYGYTRDLYVEQLWRDNRLNAIHEGTNGIQAIDLLGRKLLNSDGKAFTLLLEQIDTTIAKARGISSSLVFGESLADFWSHLAAVLDDLKGSAATEMFDDATQFMRAFGHGIVAWLWLDQVVASTAQGSSPLDEGLTYACRYFFESELPQAHGWLSIVAKHSDIVRAIPEGVFR